MKYICILTYILSPPGINITNRKLFKTLIDYYPLYPRDGILYLKTFPGFVLEKAFAIQKAILNSNDYLFFSNYLDIYSQNVYKTQKKTKHRA